MKHLALAGLALGVVVAAPAAALEHEVVIDHVSGPIAADYKGAVTVDTKQVGSAGVAGRPSTLRCNWTASLTVERVAQVADTLQSRRTITQNDVATGSRPGWCQTSEKAIDKDVAARGETMRGALLALIDTDRSALLAEADAARGEGRDG